MQLRSTCRSAHSNNRLASRRRCVPLLSRSKAVITRAQIVWGARIVSASPLLGDTSTKLKLKVVDAATDERSPEYNIDEWDAPVSLIIDGTPGWSRTGYIKMPASFETPSAVLITKEASLPDKPSVDFISRLELLTPKDGLHKFIANSWVSSEHGERAFFGLTCLPKDTPPHLLDDRAEELKILRGEGGVRSTNRTYDYQPLDDVGPNRPKFNTTEFPLPLRTASKGKDKKYLPYDEQYDYTKHQGFNGDALAGVLLGMASEDKFTFGMELNALTAVPFFLAGVANKIANKKGWQPFDKPVLDQFSDINKLFKEDIKLNPDVALKVSEITQLLETGPLEEAAVGKPFKEQKLKGKEYERQQGQSAAAPTTKDALKRALSDLKGETAGRKASLDDLLSFTLPRVEAGREGQWATDKEFGRQQLAGCNMFDLCALGEMPTKRGSAIASEHVDAELKQLDLQGRTMEQLVQETVAGKKPRLFISDYWYFNTFWKEAPVVPNRAEHCGRAIFFLVEDEDGNETGLIPIAIELATRDTVRDNAGVVYSRHELQGEKQILWQLAKAVFRSLENLSVQVHHHWLRSHVVMEAFVISMRRNMSIMHPISKLMLPHFKYLINTNINGRTNVFGEKGFMEGLYGPNAYITRIASTLYKNWSFKNQGLPAELRQRGFAFISGESNVSLQIKDFPYAQDGMDMFNTIRAYFAYYVRLYYKTDADVANDTELQAWWAEVKEKGHPDLMKYKFEQIKAKQPSLTPEQVKEAAERQIWGAVGPITQIPSLIQTLATIAWLCTGFHTAVNYGAYDFSAYLLNMSPNIRRPIPKPDAVEDPAYKALVKASGKKQETEFLTYLASFEETLKVMTFFKVLCTIADGEHTIDEPNTMLTDPVAVQLNKNFCNQIRALEVRFLNRNLDSKRWTRYKGSPESMAFTQLYPSSSPGLTLRGVPYSATI